MSLNEPETSRWATLFTKHFQEAIRGHGILEVDYLSDGFEFKDGNGKRFKIQIKEIVKKTWQPLPDHE